MDSPYWYLDQEKRKEGIQRMTIYMCSPYRADYEERFKQQKAYAATIAREIVTAGHEVIAPHMYYPLFLNDEEPEEREAGLSSAIRLLHVCDAILICKHFGISHGMRREIAKAETLHVMILEANTPGEARELLKYHNTAMQPRV